MMRQQDGKEPVGGALQHATELVLDDEERLFH